MPILVLLLAVVLGSCASPPNQQPAPADATAAVTPKSYPNNYPDQALTGHPAADVMTVQQSSVLVKVYRAGRLQHLGHNHILSSTDLTGLIHWPADDPAPKFAHLYVAADSFVVDDPALRAVGGSDFASKPSTADRAATRRNMLGPKVLNAQQHPWLEFMVSPAVASQTASVTMAIAGQRSEVNVPVTATPAANSSRRTVVFTASFRLSHGQLGLSPFSALAGALRVADELEIDLRLTAVASHSASVQ